ncbi:hypothetical protein OIV83_002285 [Microbotryomycetes sp. JL201]|nr:hypothetical protein OIV83_002285 [Microbotryomycetes sp. JL201]
MSDPVVELRALLGTYLRVRISSTGRTFVGQFACIDKQGNLVLEDTTEYYDATDNQPEYAHTGRHVGMVLVPKRHWKSIERQIDPFQTTAQLDPIILRPVVSEQQIKITGHVPHANAVDSQMPNGSSMSKKRDRTNPRADQKASFDGRI